MLARMKDCSRRLMLERSSLALPPLQKSIFAALAVYSAKVEAKRKDTYAMLAEMVNAVDISVEIASVSSRQIVTAEARKG